MNIVGIIIETNPFHNGHMYFINEIKEKYQPDLIIAVTSTSFTMRGEISLLNKFDKSLATKLSLLTRLMNNTTKNYSTKRDFVNKLYDLYDASVSVYSYPSYKTSINIFRGTKHYY